MYNCYTEEQICLMNRLRLLWEQHVYRTRFFIISTAADLGDLKAVTDRLLQNPKDFADLFAPFYGNRAAQKLEELLTEHLLIAADLVNAAKKGETYSIDEIRRKWYDNADEIACFLSGLNRYWDESEWQSMLYSHLETTEKEAVLRLQGDYEADIKIFERIEAEALQMVDYMFCGIVRHCF